LFVPIDPLKTDKNLYLLLTAALARLADAKTGVIENRRFIRYDSGDTIPRLFQPMISVQHLSKHYGDYGETTAIDDVTFTVERGEVLAFLGPNGAGKTTTMRILAGLIAPTSGSATVAGYDVLTHPMEVKRRIGYLPDNPPLYTEMTVDEYLTFAGKIRGLRGRAVTLARDAVLEKCALGDVRGRLIANLSRGYRQRVGLAQAMIHSPDVLILDEPTVGLDPKQIIDIRELVKSLAGEQTIILSTHILPEATAVCQRVVIINRGRIVAVDSRERLSMQLRQSEKLAVRVRRGEGVDLGLIYKIEGVTQITPQEMASGSDGAVREWMIESEMGADIREAVASTIVQQGWGLLEMRPVVASLEEVFLQLTTQAQGVETAYAAGESV